MGTGQRTLGAIGTGLSGNQMWRASPDGQQILTFDRTGDFSVLEQRKLIQYRSEFVRWTGRSMAAPGPVGAVWLPDSRRWLSWTPGPDKYLLHLYSIDSPHGAPVSVSTSETMSYLVGVTPDYLVVQTDTPSPPSTAKRVTLTTFGVYPNSATARIVSFPLPVTAQISGLELAPQGDRLAWLLVDARRTPFITMLIRLIPSMSGRFPPTEGISVWVSRLDGTEMHEIGFQQTHSTGKDTNVTTDLRWMPDGKHLSFLMNNSLYSVPAP